MQNRAFLPTEKDLNMKIIVESGATKTAWRSVDDAGTIRGAQSVGMNPSSLDPDEIKSSFRKVMPVLNPEGKRVDEVFFYGAGLVSEEASAPIRECLEMWCPLAEISFLSDLLAAARALFGDGSGIVAIMGTGSNTCLYEKGKITRNISSGGYVLGDEGGAVYLGKTFLKEFVRGQLPKDIEEEFIREYRLDYPAIVRKVYREPGASAFMASFAPFVMSRVSNPYVKMMVDACMDGFFKSSIARYKLPEGFSPKVGVVGSYGCACEPFLRYLGYVHNMDFVKFIKSPIDELVKYHGI